MGTLWNLFTICKKVWNWNSTESGCTCFFVYRVWTRSNQREEKLILQSDWISIGTRLFVSFFILPSLIRRYICWKVGKLQYIKMLCTTVIHEYAFVRLVYSFEEPNILTSWFVLLINYSRRVQATTSETELQQKLYLLSIKAAPRRQERLVSHF